MKPTITPEGQAAANRIREVRQNINNGATAAGARATVRALEDPTTRNQRRANELNQNNPNFVAFNNQPRSQRNVPPPTTAPSVTAADLTTPPPSVNPPVVPPSQNTGSRTTALVDTTAANTQNFITAQTEEARKRDELAGLLGTQTFDGAGERERLGQQFGLPDNLTRLGDIQTQLARANTQSGLTQVSIAGADGQTLGQAQREITQEDRENAVRNAGLAAEANVLQGNIETASTLINSAMSDFYADRQLQNQNMIQQLEYFSSRADEQTSQLLKQEQRKYEEDQANIARARSLVDSAVGAGYLAGSDLQSVLSISDPAVQAEQAQMIIARGIQNQIAAEKAAAAAAAAAKGFASPETKNFGTTDAPVWKQWNKNTGTWEDVSGVAGGGASPEEAQKSLDQISFLRDNAQRILGGTDPVTGESFDPLYKASGKGVVDRVTGFFVGDTKYNRLEAYSDTLKTNVLALMTDPTVRKFFGPQMSNADVRLMSSAGTSLRPDSQSPEELKAEVNRLDDLFNRMQTAVKNGQTQSAPVQGPMIPVNVITAPDGTQIELID